MRNIPNIYPCFNETYSSSFVVFWNYLGFHHLATVRISSSSGKILLLFGQLNLLLGCPFAKLLRNFCRTKRKIFLSLRISFARKKTRICAIIRKSHFAQNCLIPLLRNSSFAQFRNFVKIKRLVTVCVSYNSILEESCFGMSSNGHFYINDQWQLRRVQISQFSRQF